MTALTDEMEIERTEAPTVLYRLFDANDVLLYVGISGNLKARFASHASTKSWWPRVARRTIVIYPTRASGQEAERVAISAENPLHNVQRPVIRQRHQPARKIVPEVAVPKRWVVRGPRPDGPGAPIYDARFAQDLTLAEVSRRCAVKGSRVSAATIAKFERGGGRIHPGVLRALAGALGMEHEQVVDIAVAHHKLRRARQLAP